ncbi:MAG: hypothetical protein ABJG15_12915 [Hyphomonadaceae bacterium]
MQIEGYAVVCENDCIADAEGKMPDSLKSDAEWAYFQAGLDLADLIVLGRKSDDVTPNPKERLRLVMTRAVTAPTVKDQGTVLWNPVHTSFSRAIDLFEVNIDRVAVTGGKEVFDYFLQSDLGYSCFHLSRMKNVYLRGGVKLFSALEVSCETPDKLLQSLAYLPSERIELDTKASVVRWAR